MKKKTKPNLICELSEMLENDIQKNKTKNDSN